MLSINHNKARKYMKLGYRKLVNSLATEVFLKTGLFLPTPFKIYYLVSNKCNYRCQMCPQWRQGIAESQSEYIGEERMKGIIKEMRALGIREFGISGGEPLVFQDKVLPLLEHANRQGLYTHFATNGSLLDEKILDRYGRSGGGHISLSIDAIGGKHDKLRGYQGAHKHITRVLAIFKKNRYKNIALKINFTLTNANLNEAVPVTRAAIENGALIFIQPYDSYAYERRNVGKRERDFPLWVKEENYGRLRDAIGKLAGLKEEYPQVILNDLKHIRAIYDYFTESNFRTQCLAALDQIAINPQGKVIFCKFGTIGDLKKQSLADFLNSAKRKEVINSSLECGNGCLLGCMYRPGIKDMIINGSKQLIRLISNKP